MKKYLITIFTLITLSFNAQGAAGLLSAPFTGSLTLALNGLLISGGSLAVVSIFDINAEEGLGPLMISTILIGLVVLDEEQTVVELKAVNVDQLTKMGLSRTEAQAYNDNTEELSIILNEIKDSAQDIEESKEMWQDYDGIVDRQAVEGLKKIIQHHAKRK